MLLTLGLMFVVGLALGAVCARLKLPRLVGMMATGLLLGPHVLNLMDAGTLAVSADLRELALIVILLRAGLSLDLAGLRRVGRPALMMSCVPALCEIFAYALLGGTLLGLSTLESALLGAVMGAVSPAVVVPGMVGLMERGLGQRNSVPQLVIAGASMDDVFVIVVFTALLSMAQGGTVSAWSFAGIPVSICLGIALGTAAGLALSALVSRWHMRDSVKVVLMLGCACLMAALEELLKGYVPMSGLLAVMAMAAALRHRRSDVAERLASKFSKVWIAAEIALFALVGAQVDPTLLAQAGVGALAMIAAGLAIRALGVWLSTARTRLTLRERIFCAIAYMPKATVQAAIGGVPLAAGLDCGGLVLAMAALAIVLTAPLGALAIQAAGPRLLD